MSFVAADIFGLADEAETKFFFFGIHPPPLLDLHLDCSNTFLEVLHVLFQGALVCTEGGIRLGFTVDVGDFIDDECPIPQCIFLPLNRTNRIWHCPRTCCSLQTSPPPPPPPPQTTKFWAGWPVSSWPPAAPPLPQRQGYDSERWASDLASWWEPNPWYYQIAFPKKNRKKQSRVVIVQQETSYLSKSSVLLPGLFPGFRPRFPRVAPSSFTTRWFHEIVRNNKSFFWSITWDKAGEVEVETLQRRRSTRAVEHRKFDAAFAELPSGAVEREANGVLDAGDVFGLFLPNVPDLPLEERDAQGIFCWVICAAPLVRRLQCWAISPFETALRMAASDGLGMHAASISAH